MAAQPDQQTSDLLGRLEQSLPIESDRVEELRSRLSQEGFHLGPPDRTEQLERWARFSPNTTELIELQYRGASPAQVRLRTRSQTTSAPPDTIDDQPLAWLTEFLHDDRDDERQAAAATRSDLPSDPRARRPATGARRRPLVVALSGLDGAGKSSQAAALIDVLNWLGLETDVFWLPLGHSGLQRTLRRLLRKLRGLRRPSRDLASAEARPERPPARPGGGGGRIGTAIWATVVAVIYALSYQRVVSRLRHRYQVIVFDRYITDAAAQVRYFYGPNRQFRFARWLLRQLSPPAGCAYLLDLEPAAALARKQDQYDLQQLSLQAELLRHQARALGVTILDAESDRDQITARITEDIWRASSV